MSALVRPNGLRIALKGMTASGAAALAIVALYAWAFRGPIHLLPSDPFGYAWQFRAIREGLLSAVDPRPGTVALGAMLTAFGPIPSSLAPTLLSFALLASIGLAVAVLGRRALALPTWALVPLAVGAATFGATTKLAAYTANLVALTCFVAGVTIILTSRSGSRLAFVGATASFLATGLAHPAIVPAWFATVGAWLLLALVLRSASGAEAGSGDDTPRPVDRRPVAAFAALVLGALGASAIVFGVLGRAPSEVGNLSTASPYFTDRLAATWDWIMPTVALSIVGSILSVLRARRHGDRSGQAVLVSWVFVCLGGTAVILVAPGFPGHRTLMLVTPLGAAAGMVAVELALLALRLKDRARMVPFARALLLTAVVVTGITGFLGLRGFVDEASAPWADRALPARQVAAYARATPPGVPIVMVIEPRSPEGARPWKARLNITRSFLDGRRAAHLFVSVGDPLRLLAGEPSVYPDSDDPLEQALDRISARTWPDVRNALRQGAVIVIPRAYVRSSSWDQAIVRGAVPSGDDLLVVGGEPISPSAVPQHASISRLGGWVAAMVSIVMLAAIGGGIGLLVSGGSGAAARAEGNATKLGDVAAAAPAYGVALCVLTGTGVAVAGGDPGGAASLALVVGVALACWLAQGARSARSWSTRSTSSVE